MGAGAWTSTAAWICLAGAGWRLAAPEGIGALQAGLQAAALAAGLLSFGAASRGRARAAAAALLATAGLVGVARLPGPRLDCQPEPRPVAIEAILLAWTPTREGWIRADLELGDPEARRWNCHAHWLAEGRWESAEPPRAGDRVRAEGLLGGTAEHPWLSVTRLWGTGERALRPAAALRQRVRERLDERLPADAAGYARALLLADWQGLSPAVRESYRRAGIIHLLAVSGMHFWLWDWLLRSIPWTRPPRLRWPSLLLLGILAGAGPAVVRSLIALLLRELAAGSGRAVASMRLWSSALLLECAFGAPGRQGLGFVLSYAATGCLLAAPAPRGDPRWRSSLHASAAASCGSAPVLHALRGTLEPWSVVATPLCALALPPRLLASLLALAPGCSGIAALSFDALGRLEQAVLGLLDRLPGTPLARPEWPAACVLASASLCLLALRARRRGRAVSALLAGFAVLPLLLPSRLQDPDGLLLLPVGHGLGAVLKGGSAALLYDLGSRGHDPADLLDRVVLPELARRGWPVPRLAVLSHPDADHAAGLALLAARNGMEQLRTGAGEELRLEGMFPYSVRVIGTRAAVAGVSNAGGPVLEIRHGGGAAPPERVVLLGDQFGYALRELRARLEPGPIALLVLPHHGLTTDGLGELLDHLQPRAAWASCGREDLPLPAVALCARRGIPLRTTADGALLWRPSPRHPRPGGTW